MRKSNESTTVAENNPIGGAGKLIDQQYLINKLNFVNFQDGTILAVYRHTQNDHVLKLLVSPTPCKGSELFCRWVSTLKFCQWVTTLEQKPKEHKMEHCGYYFDSLLIADNGSYLQVEPQLIESSGGGVLLRLPQQCRRIKRDECDSPINPNLKVALFQKGACYEGRLLALTDVRLTFEIHYIPPQTRHWVDPQANIQVVISEDEEIYFSDSCPIDEHHSYGENGRLVLNVANSRFRRLKPKKYRSQRVTMKPSPDMLFSHPINGRQVMLKVESLSGSGLAVQTNPESNHLLPGLVIPKVRLEIAGETFATFKAQVVHHHRLRSNNGSAKTLCGLVILDIGIADHTRLHQLALQAHRPNVYFNNRVSPEALWDFFFSSGFVYPDKYGLLAEDKQRIRRLYTKLYQEQPTFARHFIYQETGSITGHVAMLRFYTRAWMLHHHAALTSSSLRAGIVVFEQIGQFINESHTLASAQMDYVFFFFRPDNKFPSRVFGGATRFMGDRQQSSLDRFDYGYFDARQKQGGTLPPAWRLVQAEPQDLELLNQFLLQNDSRLLIKAFDLEPGNKLLYELSSEYEKLGFKRERLLFALKKGSRLKAFFEVNLADVGLNMSDLTNSIRVTVIDPDEISKPIIGRVLELLCDLYDMSKVPVLVFPADGVLEMPFPFERQYMVWILNLQYADRYLEFTDRLLRVTRGSA